ncbi:hypothetical protein GH733_004632 [Mirounga leonina]|nr:hypothetical protein GH733_004632 [Mirounga leonina]
MSSRQKEKGGFSLGEMAGLELQNIEKLPRGAVHRLLGGSDGMDGGHESLHDAEVVMDDLGQRSQAVGGAGGIADNLEGVVILLMVHTHHQHGGIGRRNRDDDPFGPTLQVSPNLLHGGEDPSGLHNTLSTSITPFDVGGISPLEDGDGLSIDDKLPVLSLDYAVEFTMGGIILEHEDHVVEVNEEVIDGDNIHFARVKSSPGDQGPNTAKSVHSDLHHRVSGTQLALHQKMRLSVEWGGAESLKIFLNTPGATLKMMNEAGGRRYGLLSCILHKSPPDTCCHVYFQCRECLLFSQCAGEGNILFIAAVGQNVDNGDLIHTFGLDGRFNVQSITLSIKIGVCFDQHILQSQEGKSHGLAMEVAFKSTVGWLEILIHATLTWIPVSIAEESKSMGNTTVNCHAEDDGPIVDHATLKMVPYKAEVLHRLKQMVTWYKKVIIISFAKKGGHQFLTLMLRTCLPALEGEEKEDEDAEDEDEEEEEEELVASGDTMP